MSFEVRNPEIEKVLQKLAKFLDGEMPPGHGFTLFIFEKGGKNVFYISNAQRESMLGVLKEFIARQTIN